MHHVENLYAPRFPAADRPLWVRYKHMGNHRKDRHIMTVLAIATVAASIVASVMNTVLTHIHQ